MIFNQIMGTLVFVVLFILCLGGFFITKGIPFLVCSAFFGILSLLFTLNSIKIIKKEKGIKVKHDFNYGLCIGFVFIAFIFGVSLALFIKNYSYRINGVETISIVYDKNKTVSYRKEHDEDGNSYEVKKEHCDVFVKYVVDEKEYKAKLEAGDCKYSVGDSVTIYYDKNDPSKFVSNSIGILIFAVLFSGFVFVLFCFKCIKAYFDTKKL